jgi:hypothetical protein
MVATLKLESVAKEKRLTLNNFREKFKKVRYFLKIYTRNNLNLAKLNNLNLAHGHEL